jgi:hypothetical protein
MGGEVNTLLPHQAFDWCVDTANTDSRWVGFHEVYTGSYDNGAVIGSCHRLREDFEAWICQITHTKCVRTGYVFSVDFPRSFGFRPSDVRVTA